MVNAEFLYDKDYFNSYFGASHVVDKQLSYQRIENGYILPHRPMGSQNAGGVLTQNKEYIEETALHTKSGTTYTFEQKQVTKKKETVVYIGMFVGIWGHCITDNIRRVWFLKTEEYQNVFAGCKLVYVPFQGFEFSESFSQLLAMLGLDCKDLVPITEITQYAEIIIPDECFFSPEGSTRYFTKEYRELIDTVRTYAAAHATPTGYDKVYFTYSSYTKGKQVGEEKLERFFQQQGYHIIAPEKLSLSQQLNMLYQCTRFASTVGSCSHNIIFLQPQTIVTLIPRANYLTGYQVALDEVQALDITYVDASLSVFVNQKYPWVGPFFYYVSDQLVRYFGETPVHDKKYWKDNFNDFDQYVTFGLHQHDPADCVPPAFYSKLAVAYLQQYLNTSWLSKFVRRWPMANTFSYCIWSDRVQKSKE